ncbi:hypothetical protein F5Y05DRAFT_398159 [Hypoxylon sp. FL0543]|nr:hypothetical protein F5Y05DRAFT_398159 [Hypoxylon sp. FL0543]
MSSNMDSNIRRCLALVARELTATGAALQSLAASNAATGTALQSLAASNAATGAALQSLATALETLSQAMEPASNSETGTAIVGIPSSAVPGPASSSLTPGIIAGAPRILNTEIPIRTTSSASLTSDSVICGPQGLKSEVPIPIASTPLGTDSTVHRPQALGSETVILATSSQLADSTRPESSEPYRPLVLPPPFLKGKEREEYLRNPIYADELHYKSLPTDPEECHWNHKRIVQAWELEREDKLGDKGKQEQEKPEPGRSPNATQSRGGALGQKRWRDGEVKKEAEIGNGFGPHPYAFQPSGTSPSVSTLSAHREISAHREPQHSGTGPSAAPQPRGSEMRGCRHCGRNFDPNRPEVCERRSKRRSNYRKLNRELQLTSCT